MKAKQTGEGESFLPGLLDCFAEYQSLPSVLVFRWKTDPGLREHSLPFWCPLPSFSFQLISILESKHDQLCHFRTVILCLPSQKYFSHHMSHDEYESSVKELEMVLAALLLHFSFSIL
ncbi:hypothetical protein AMECASPLE_031781 [Ameca splendens]|uniref:Uncharacterized protein n=1 Tax=Ameca splendens TaxID=208324 RepID=A0ABV1ACT4_9TELE